MQKLSDRFQYKTMDEFYVSEFVTIEKINLDSKGNVIASEKPGLGISLDENWIKDNIVDRIKIF